MSDQPRMSVVDDRTPLGGATIDVASRIAWTMRMARLTSDVPDPRLKALSPALSTSPARMSRAETGQLRDGSLVDGYERVLGLVEGSLRAPVDVLARTFPEASPPDARPGEPISSVADLSDLTMRLDAGGPVTGGDWLRWTRAMAVPGNIGLPVPLARRVATRLVQELSRSCGHGYPSRYEALATLRCSDYGFLVLGVAQHESAHPYAQGLADLFSAVGESATPDAVEWCLGLLGSDRPHLVACAVAGLENMGAVSADPAFWPGVVGGLVEALDGADPGSDREEWLAHLVRVVPPTVWRHADVRPARPLPPAPGVEGFDRDRANRQWQQCTALASDVGHEVGVGEQPMLARLVFDIGFGHWETRAVTSYLLVAALPALAAPLWDRLRRMADAEPDERIRHRMARRLTGAVSGSPVAGLDDWLASPDPVLRSSALQIAGAAGQHLDGALLGRALSDPGTARAAGFAMGMSAHPSLGAVAADPEVDPEVRGAAAWWLARGPRVAV